MCYNSIRKNRNTIVLLHKRIEQEIVRFRFKRTTPYVEPINDNLAQLVEHRTFNAGVESSNLLIVTNVF